ncbi:hypothetical protein [Devosia sp. Root635]|uniref:hypothetical protein n=1 Tax=Devosia sp. Root635 TaxID=1736575 RepID=UPI0006F46453|nr:hypothetical protein [Devosia sp. Root635]KRA55908.1 hypothetical protein ASD80_01080 [Devosia sp. Root635]
MDEWPPVRCPRFDGERLESYRRRVEQVTEIVTKFRRGLYSAEVADEMEALLDRLRSPELAEEQA